MTFVALISRYSSGFIRPKLSEPMALGVVSRTMLDCVLQFEARCDAQRLHLVEEELERVAHLDVVNVGLLVAVRTVHALLLDVLDGCHPTLGADRDELAV